MDNNANTIVFKGQITNKDDIGVIHDFQLKTEIDRIFYYAVTNGGFELDELLFDNIDNEPIRFAEALANSPDCPIKDENFVEVLSKVNPLELDTFISIQNYESYYRGSGFPCYSFQCYNDNDISFPINIEFDKKRLENCYQKYQEKVLDEMER